MSDDPRRLDRRDFTLKLALGALVAATGGLLTAALRLALPRSRRGRWLAVGEVGDFLPGAWRLLDEAPIYVVTTELGVAALSARCSHLGCTVRRRGNGFVCPCHGSSFDDQGRALRPPATEPLRWLKVEVVDGTVYVDPDRSVGARQFTALEGRGA